MKNVTKCPMQSAHNAPRCQATSKRTGNKCKNPAVKGWQVCRMHGARGGSKAGLQANAYKHGGHTSSAKEFKNEIAAFVKQFDQS